MISLDEIEFGPGLRKTSQAFQQRDVVGKDQVTEADPELENVSQQKERIKTLLPVEEIQQQAIIFVLRRAQVGVSQKYCSHAATIKS